MEKDKKIVLVTGVFDVLHQEHRRFLQKARALGGHLVVALESDIRVTELKGEGRPINNESKRQANLAAWQLADEILILPTDFGNQTVRHDWLRNLKPQILAVSSHSPFLAVKRKMMKEIGGELAIVHQFNPQLSSSRLINKNGL